MPRKTKESDVIKGVYNWLSGKKHKVVCPNVKLFNWESDVISLSSVEMIYEFEVKLSKEDFKRDFDKPKHLHFSGEGETFEVDGETRHYVDRNIPSKFYFVFPEGMVPPEDVPDYAGILHYDYHPMTDMHVLQEIRPAKEFHRDRAKPEHYVHLAKSLAHKLKKHVVKNKKPWGT